MRAPLLLLAADLLRRGEAFALATVVARKAPSSARVGDTALITQGGACHGWVGGSCTQSTVVREARRALAEGTPRLIALSPTPNADGRSDATAFPLTCQSGGSLDIYIEPVVPASRLVVFGLSPVAQAVVRLAKAAGYAVDAVDPAADRVMFPEADRVVTSLQSLELRARGTAPGVPVFAIVATMGQWDEEATRMALALEPAYLGLVASRRRFGQIRETLVARGADTVALERVSSPAGLDIGALTPEEIALSILAELVLVHRGGARATEPAPSPVEAEAGGEERAGERDPVCSMTVATATAEHRAEFGGRLYYFCCSGCRERFLAAPDRFVAAGAGGSR
ncbi:MAG: XdhC family protein [Gemmatimonadales bacterium]